MSTIPKKLRVRPAEIRRTDAPFSKEQKCVASVLVGALLGVPLLAAIAVISGAFLYPSRSSLILELADAADEFCQILAWPGVDSGIWAIKRVAPLVWMMGPVCGLLAGALVALWIWRRDDTQGPLTKLPHFTTERLEEWLEKAEASAHSG